MVLHNASARKEEPRASIDNVAYFDRDANKRRSRPLVSSDVDSRKLMDLYFDRDSIIEETETALLDGNMMPIWRQRMVALAWREKISGSLPNDDVKLARLICGGNLERWLELKKTLLADWIECDNDRLYHPDVADRINRSWRAYKQRRDASEAAKAKRKAKASKYKADSPAGVPVDGPAEVMSRHVTSRQPPGRDIDYHLDTSDTVADEDWWSA